MSALPSSVDLNADVGEATDDEGMAAEHALFSVVTSVNVACGGHAGDARSMRITAQAALDRGVRVGAHPSYPDREGFGRRPMTIEASALKASLRDQLTALAGICASLGTTLHSVKPHGALYSQTARAGVALDALRAAMAESCAPDTALVLPAGSPAIERCRDEGLAVWAEGFCDRAYAPDGTLVDRATDGAVFTDPERAARQAVELACAGSVDTLCIHGDSPGAVAMAVAVRQALLDAGMAVRAPR